MSAQGSGVRLTATTVPDDSWRPSDGPALLNEHSGSASPSGADGTVLAVAAFNGGVFVPSHPRTTFVDPSRHQDL
jgi:hypothetical protein